MILFQLITKCKSINLRRHKVTLGKYVKGKLFFLHNSFWTSLLQAKSSSNEEQVVGLYISLLTKKPILCKFELDVENYEYLTSDDIMREYTQFRFFGYKNFISLSELESCINCDDELHVKITLQISPIQFNLNGKDVY